MPVSAIKLPSSLSLLASAWMLLVLLTFALVRIIESATVTNFLHRSGRT
jgi:hypothetical protein